MTTKTTYTVVRGTPFINGTTDKVVSTHRTLQAAIKAEFGAMGPWETDILTSDLSAAYTEAVQLFAALSASKVHSKYKVAERARFYACDWAP